MLKKIWLGKGKNVEENMAYMYLVIAQKNLNDKNFDEAIRLAKDAGKILDKNNNKDSALAYNIVCYAYFATQRYKEAVECYDSLKIENLEDMNEKFKAHKSKAELLEYIGKLYKGIESETIEVNGTFVTKDKSIERISTAIAEYNKALKIGKALNLNTSEINYLEKKISDLNEYAKELQH